MNSMLIGYNRLERSDLGWAGMVGRINFVEIILHMTGEIASDYEDWCFYFSFKFCKAFKLEQWFDCSSPSLTVWKDSI